MTKVEHLLVCLMEECAEVQKDASKALRFGLDASNPYKKDDKPNSDKIMNEFGDIIAIIHLLQEEGCIPDIDLTHKINRKKEKTLRYINWELEKEKTV